MKRTEFLIPACILAGVFALGLTGMTLADGSDSAGGGDRLIGVLVTPESLDLFDWDGYLNAHAGEMVNGSLTADGTDPRFQRRLYAAREPDAAEGGAYTFAGVEGWPLFSPLVTENGEEYRDMVADGIVPGPNEYAYTDDGQEITFSGTLYVDPSAGHTAFFGNPVYQSADGSVYALGGTGISSGGSPEGQEGASMGQTLAETSTVTEDGRTETEKLTVTFTVQGLYPPERIAVVQLDGEHRLLSRAEYAPGRLPESLTPAPGTAYLLVESYRDVPPGEAPVVRALYQPPDADIETFFLRPDGVCARCSTEIHWPE